MANSPQNDELENKKAEKLADKDLIDIALARFSLAVEAEAKEREEQLDDLKFYSGDQWDAATKASREEDKRPTLSINRLPGFLRQVTNEQRQNRPSIKVNPVDDKATVETARVQQGMTRQIENDSGADVAYDTGFESAARIGKGFWRVVTEFINPMSFLQKLVIKRIRNRFMVYMDPSSKEPDGSDQNWCFVTELLLKDEFKAQFPDAEQPSGDAFSSLGDSSPLWLPDGYVRVCEYFYKDWKDVTLVQLSDQTVIQKDQLPEKLPTGVKIAQERRTRIPIVKWCKITGVEVLERSVWPGQWIPIVPVIGEELDIDGKVIYKGIVRDAKDPQRMLNYWKSAETEAIALAPRAPFIGASGQFEGHEDKWGSANRRNHPYLEYEPVSLNGQPVGPPQRSAVEPAVMAITQASREASEDLKAVTGIYDAALGNRSNETSGVAIQRRNAQAQTANYHLIDNLHRSIRHTGRILLDAYPKVYDTARVVQLLHEDGTQEAVRINEKYKDGKEDKHFPLNVGKYDSVVEAGPSFQTRREEAVASMLDLTKSMPMVAQNIADLLVKNMDWPGAQEISERLKKMLPPGVADDEKGAPPIPPALKAQMDQAQQMIDMLSKQLHEAKDTLQNKKLELESRERIAEMSNQTQLELKYAELNHKDGVELMAAKIAQIELQLQHSHEAEQNAARAEEVSEASPDGAAPPEEPAGGEAPSSSMEQEAS